MCLIVPFLRLLALPLVSNQLRVNTETSTPGIDNVEMASGFDHKLDDSLDNDNEYRTSSVSSTVPRMLAVMRLYTCLAWASGYLEEPPGAKQLRLKNHLISEAPITEAFLWWGPSTRNAWPV
ncbi:hypothetical protein BDP81DRAFT_10028 [Colletotrichum phormii]|uniref:Secreted protein n=1 Tax=Colletotrichum phormii TaxID=359342 RepID=A0AAJ0EL11_9PEZI|nr:uncharacterized protein BDP81DRAFT_10028 [Colletotrichum phormii]KAK1655786.1 hypothetical protein BDP81DRAFT_10028 [Colletotrichum phormii]